MQNRIRFMCEYRSLLYSRQHYRRVARDHGAGPRYTLDQNRYDWVLKIMRYREPEYNTSNQFYYSRLWTGLKKHDEEIEIMMGYYLRKLQ